MLSDWPCYVCNIEIIYQLYNLFYVKTAKGCFISLQLMSFRQLGWQVLVLWNFP